MNLCRKNVIESWKTNLLRIGLMYGIMTVIFVWAGYFNYDYMLPGPDVYDPTVNTALNVFAWFGLICGCISASFTMENLKSKTGRLSALMIPATPFEKYFSRWFVSTVVFIVVFIIAFLLADYTRVLIYSIAYPEQNVVVAKLSYIFSNHKDYGIEWNSGTKIRVSILFYFFMQSCFVLGSSIWPKNALIKTFVAGFFMLLLYGFAVAGIAYLFFEETSFSSRSLPVGYESALGTLVYIVTIFFILLNWTLAYFRFKETEIINRL